MSNEQQRLEAASEAINASHMLHCVHLVENELRFGSAFGPFEWEADHYERNYGVGRTPPACEVTIELLDEMMRSVPIPRQLIKAAAVTMNAQKAAATRVMEHPDWGIESRKFWLPGVR